MTQKPVAGMCIASYCQTDSLARNVLRNLHQVYVIFISNISPKKQYILWSFCIGMPYFNYTGALSQFNKLWVSVRPD